MRGAIYCRVSTEDQEREGTSLQTQLEACLAYCQHKGLLYDDKYRERQEAKHAWYRKHGFAERLIITAEERGFDSITIAKTMDEHFKN